ncbi:oligosaccharyltransferase complex subunit ostc-like isoform X2 [Hyperolius riggenbachi]|uniref:oligosaccharyltransferase complex subunit ostc-like isoform X2 n=1 Tax=Hyperolius riggenbachi TaxID=752182 RepID=UPI0035A3C01C
MLTGIIYDVIVEPPSVGSMTDEHGHQRPVAFLAYRVNGQYIMEGLASSFLFTMGGLGFIILDRSNAPNIPKLNRFLLLFIGFVCVLLSFFMARVFMRMKLPSANSQVVRYKLQSGSTGDRCIERRFLLKDTALLTNRCAEGEARSTLSRIGLLLHSHALRKSRSDADETSRPW